MKRVAIKSSRKRQGAYWLMGLFISIMVLSPFVCTSPVFATAVYMDAGPEQFKGVKFTLEVVLDEVTDLYGAAYDITYDTEYLDVVDGDPATDGVQPKVVEGGLLSEEGNDTTFVRSALEDEAQGTVVFGITRSGDVAGVDTFSDSVILAVTFIPKKLGSTSVMFNRQGLRDSGNETIAVDPWEDLTLNIQRSRPAILTTPAP